jgi:hypothetical protein
VLTAFSHPQQQLCSVIRTSNIALRAISEISLIMRGSSLISILISEDANENPAAGEREGRDVP